MQVKSEYYEPNDFTLGAGTIIPVRLLTGINTDVEGQVMAQVLADVYDSATGTKLLIPQGSKLVGSTVTIEPGYEFNVYVTNNITF